RLQRLRRPDPAHAAKAGAGLAQERDELRWRYGHAGFAAAQKAPQLFHVKLVAAEIHGNRHGEGNEARVLAGEEVDDEFGSGVGDQGNAIAARKTEVQKA